jgi:hypothetical protein
MAKPQTKVLNDLIGHLAANGEVNALISRLNEFQSLADGQDNLNELLTIYDKAAASLEQRLYDNDYPDALMQQHRLLYQEMESQITNMGRDYRHDFIIVIPVADRPLHLKNCLGTLLSLCERFAYGGKHKRHYDKVRVVIADDSQDQNKQNQIREITEEFDHQGLSTCYFGPKEQIQQLEKLEKAQRQSLEQILGNHPTTAFYHKGASITRNICYLKLKELISDNPKTLIWFIDSDQEFRVTIGASSRTVYAINYFHQIDRIFTNTNPRVLTGKVVGDPPVSPAVMGGNFLQDVAGFLSRIAKLEPHTPCEFHQRGQLIRNDAAYHDMAELFGFKPHHHPYRYHCSLSGEHDNSACLDDFAAKLNAFFDGQHPTRQTYYDYLPLDSSIAPARTVYTGNYIINTEALGYFIPFATLGLRMAGPVLGRILQTEMGDGFISANLPLNHRRTLPETRVSEFRSGVARHRYRIDLSGEFERQFFGDVMLFSIKKLIKTGFPGAHLAEETIKQVVVQTEIEIRQIYQSKQSQIITSIESLEKLINNQNNWWFKLPCCTDAIKNLNHFMANIDSNFGEAANCYRLINDTIHCDDRCLEITRAIRQYPEDRNRWQETLGRLGQCASS